MKYSDTFLYHNIAATIKTPHGHAVQLRDYQLDALSMMDGESNVSIRFPRQYGGTTLAVIHIVKALLDGSPGTKLALASCNQRMGEDTIRRIVELLHAMGMAMVIHRYTREYIELLNFSSIRLINRASPGIPCDYTTVYLDEINEHRFNSNNLFALRGRTIRINCNMGTTDSYITMHRGVLDFSDVYVDLTQAIQQLGVSAVKREYFGERFDKE